MEVNRVVKTGHPEMQKMRITLAEIGEVKRRHIERNLLYSPEEAGQVLGKSARTILDLVKDGKLVAADDAAAHGRKASPGIRITAESLESYRQSILVPVESWAK